MTNIFHGKTGKLNQRNLIGRVGKQVLNVQKWETLYLLETENIRTYISGKAFMTSQTQQITHMGDHFTSQCMGTSSSSSEEEE